MFEIKLQQNISEPIKIEKSIRDLTTLHGTLKQNTSIIDPIIIIESDLTSFINANYMTIPSFNRKYFITDIKSITNNLIEISAHVDVLTTYANQIKSNKAIINKQEYKWNLYLNDGSLRTYQNPKIITKTFPSGFDTQEFILAIAGS